MFHHQANTRNAKHKRKIYNYNMPCFLLIIISVLQTDIHVYNISMVKNSS